MSANIKRCFISRWGNEGYILEADFSQLEVIGAAIVSGDPMMKQDILDGIDSHSQSAAWLNPEYSYEEIREGYLDGDEYFTKLRKNAKAPRFELQYGAGAFSISENNGISREQAQGFINAYYDRYRVLKEFQEYVMSEVKASIKPSGRRSPSGIPLGVGKWQSPLTGRIFTFEEQESPEWMRKKGIDTSISPTQIANYPMQGFATGDIVPHMLGVLHRQLHRHRNVVKPINTIHDSVLFDVRGDRLMPSGTIIQKIMELTPRYMEKHFNIDISEFPFNVDLEYGRNWDEMKHLKL